MSSIILPICCRSEDNVEEGRVRAILCNTRDVHCWCQEDVCQCTDIQHTWYHLLQVCNQACSYTLCSLFHSPPIHGANSIIMSIMQARSPFPKQSPIRHPVKNFAMMCPMDLHTAITRRSTFTKFSLSIA